MLLVKNAIQRLFSAHGNCKPICAIINSIQTRTKVIYYLPKPTETKRVRKQGFNKKVQTRTGRKDLMVRILKGDKVIAQ